MQLLYISALSLTMSSQLKRRTGEIESDPASTNEPPPEKQAHVEVTALPNPHLASLDGDFLYHIGYSRHEIREIFHDVKVHVVYVSLVEMFEVMKHSPNTCSVVPVF